MLILVQQTIARRHEVFFIDIRRETYTTALVVECEAHSVDREWETYSTALGIGC